MLETKTIEVEFLPGKNFCYVRCLDASGNSTHSIVSVKKSRIRPATNSRNESVWQVQLDTIGLILMLNGDSDDITIRYINEAPVIWYEYRDDDTVRRCFNLNRGGTYFHTWMLHDFPPLYKCVSNFKGSDMDVPVQADEFIKPALFWTDIDFSKADKVELLKIASFCTGSGLCDELERAVKNRDLPAEEIQAAKARVEAYEANINAIIAQHKDEISANVKNFESLNPGFFDFDCGWISWCCDEGSDSSIANDIHILTDCGIRPKGSELNIDNSWACSSSTSAQRVGAEKIVKLLSDAGFHVWFLAHLD